jgi:hypothetical protein
VSNSSQRHGHERNQLDGSEQPDDERGPGQQVQLEGQGDERRLGPQIRHEAAADDQPEITTVAKGREVRAQTGETQPK